MLKWTESFVIGCGAGLWLSLYVVSWNSDWSAVRSGLVVLLLTAAASILASVAGFAIRVRNTQSASSWYAIILAGFSFVVGIGILTALRHTDGPKWLSQLPPSPESDAVLWQVQTTLVSVGFAGLAIAAQLFAEAPLAIGASRGRVLGYIWANWFVGVGLVANLLIAVESIWISSDLGVLVVAVLGFVPTLVLLVASAARLMQLFGRPSLLDEVVRVSLTETLSKRLDEVARRYGEARRQLQEFSEPEFSIRSLGSSATTFRVPVPRVGAVIKAIKPHIIRRAINSIAPQAKAGTAATNDLEEFYAPARVAIDVEPGDRTRLGETAFRVTTAQNLNGSAQDQIRRLLQSSLVFEPAGFVTPDEETDREIANLKDTIGTSLRAGAFGTAERALELLGHVVRGVWTARPESLDSSRRSSSTRRDWLFRSIGEAEQDVLLSRRAAGLFVDQAMTRALDAPRTGSTEYVDECLRSFNRLWSDILRYGDDEFDSLPSRITTCLQNLASFAYSTADQRQSLEARAIWAMVELVKMAIDAHKSNAARLAAQELDGLFEFSGQQSAGRAHVRAGQLVLAGWLNFLADKQDQRALDDVALRKLVTPRGTWSEILFARTLAERGAAPFTQWDWWEMKTSSSGRAQVLELSHYVDRATVNALSSSHGRLPPANDQETASEYARLLRLIVDGMDDLQVGNSSIKQALAEEVDRWRGAENARLANEPLSLEKIGLLQAALREALDASGERRLAAEIPAVVAIPEHVQESHPILGMNFRVPRHYLVDQIFNQTYADPKELGRIIARGFKDGEDERILAKLRSEARYTHEPTAHAIHRQLDALGDEAPHFVLVTPYGGFDDLEEWYSSEFQGALSSVKQVESASLENEAFLLDRRDSLLSCREPEEKVGLKAVEGTSIAFGVFEDVQGGAEPQVRIETGEHFVVWATESPSVHRFARPADEDEQVLNERR